jgi:hypothetical protein
MKKIHWPSLAAALTAAYFLFAIGAIASFNLGLPAWLEQPLSLLAAPGVLLLLAWNPVFRPLGMVSGEAVSAPNALACLLIIALYAWIAWLLTGVVCRRRARRAGESHPPGV